MSEHLRRLSKENMGQPNLAHYQILLENSYTRITQWIFAPGEQTGWHKHKYNYVTIQQSDGGLLLQGSDGTEKWINYQAGRTVAWRAPIEHNAVNISDVTVKVLEIEYK